MAAGALPSLQTLGVGRNQIGDQGAAALASAWAAGGCRSLAKVFLCDNHIGDAGAAALAAALARYPSGH